MTMWTILGIIAVVIIIGIAYYSTVGVMKRTAQRASASDTPISKAVQENPILMNPIILMYIVFGLFTGIIIFYYWAQYGY